mmetsp:Transcript_35684/g.82997  ORF Transcript_35684/g.82997 Transcript_35684/m.82997 type:complete len:171 (+) Transcript_35684:148-660(+)
MVIGGEEKKEASESDNTQGIKLATERRKNNYDVFEDWLRENGAEFSSLELKEYPGPEGGSAASTTICGSSISTQSTAALGANASCDVSGDNAGSLKENEMRGVHTKITVPPGTVCMAVPRQCLITVEMGKATDIGHKIVEADLELDAPKHIFLMVYLLVRFHPNDNLTLS